MNNLENLKNTSNRAYSEFISQDVLNTEGRPLYGNEEQKQVSKSSVRAGSSWGHYRLAALCLGLLSALLLVVDIGLGVHYTKLKENHLPLYNNITHISNDLTKLQGALKIVIQNRDEARRQLATEINQRGVSNWELEHQQRRSRDYDGLIERIRGENTELLSSITLAEESCKYCMPGWTLLNSMCYYFSFSNAITKRSWMEARENCRKKGADLAIIDSREKQLSISKLINEDQVHTRANMWSGFWIGLTDERIGMGTWTWRTGRRLTEGYWIPGEPNNHGHESCAATYARDNPLQTWNNAPCEHSNKWICEMAPIVL